MTKNEFMIELAGLISKIPEDERNDAINYYENYFADAGIESDMLVPASVGNPKQVADKIIGEAVYGESTSQEDVEPKEDFVYYKKDKKEKSGTYYGGSADNGYQDNQKTDSDNSKLIIGIVIAVITFPIWVGILTSIAGILFGIFAALGGMIFGFGVAGISLVIIAFLSETFAGGALIMGIGILLLALAFIFVIPLVMFCGQFIPWLVRKCVILVKNLLGKKE